MKKIYLAGLWNEYENNWKKLFEPIEGLKFYDPEIHSDQTSADTFFPEDLRAIKDADIMVANPGATPCEGTWIEVGYFLANNTKEPGDKCDNLIIIWKNKRPDWSIEFVKQAGVVVNSVEDAIEELNQLQ